MSLTWPSVRLGDLLLRSDHTIFLHPELVYKEVTVRMNGKGVVERRRVKGIEIASDRRYEASCGQFIVSRIDARHGASGLIPNELDGAVVTNDFPLFNIAKGKLNPLFLSWMSKTASFVDLCKRASEGTTNRVRLSEERFAALEILIPPLDEQERIVACIGELFAKIEEARTLRRTSQAELSAFTLSKSRSVFRSLAAEAVPLGSVCSAIIDNLHSNPLYVENGSVPCVRSPDVGYGTLDLASARRTDEAEYVRRTVRGEPELDDIVLVREGGGTGKCALVGPDHRFSLGQRVMMLRPDKSRVRSKYFLYQLLSPTIQEDHISSLSKGSAAPHLNIGALRLFPFKLPDLTVQDDIVSELDALRVKVDTVKALQTETAIELDAMLPAILDKAFKGEL